MADATLASIKRDTEIAQLWATRCTELEAALKSRDVQPRDTPDADRNTIRDCEANCKFFVDAVELAASRANNPADDAIQACVRDAQAALYAIWDIADRYGAMLFMS